MQKLDNEAIYLGYEFNQAKLSWWINCTLSTKIGLDAYHVGRLDNIQATPLAYINL